jgi:ABC-2 type transport system ATP-binding protein
VITIRSLNKSYGDFKALQNLSLEIKEGSVFGLLGVNGAGKTTLLSILNGLIDFDEGEVIVGGYDLKSQKKEVKSISSIIPQHLAFYEALSVRENLDFFASVQKSSKESLQKAIEINRLQELLSHKASTLSGGQKRRLNIAIGLLNDPKIIYFDEPTVGIDPRSRGEILDSIKSYRDMGITVVYTSHYMNEIEYICDEVAIIDKGRLIKQERLENLLSNKLSDSVLIESVADEKLAHLGLNLLERNLIQTDKSRLCDVLALLEKEKIYIKQIRYGASDLEHYFLEVTE